MDFGEERARYDWTENGAEAMSKSSTLTAAAYHTKYLAGGNASLARLLRWVRMLKREAKV